LTARFGKGWHDGIQIDASDIADLCLAADALEQQAAQIEALRADAERLRLLLSDARCALDYHQEQTRPIHSTRTALEAIDAELRKV